MECELFELAEEQVVVRVAQYVFIDRSVSGEL
jgi:hypothetical protein